MCLLKNTRRITILPRFMLTSVRMTTSLVSKLHVSPVSKPPASRAKPAHPGSVVSALTVQNVMAAAAHHVAGSVMTSVPHVARVKTSPSA